jgi:D-alanyl-D-alanine carboxypeptidase/D-alanyl-D-alanine-endopeptidase (penicillin-binding protein 4)
VGAAVCVVVAIRDDDSAAATPTNASSSAVAAPLLSPRRAPAVFLDAAARARLARSLNDAVGGLTACVAVDTRSGQRIATVGTDDALAGGSNQKLLVAAAALRVLGPDHRLVTRVVSDAPLDGGTLHGDLTMVGGGDPLLATPAYEQYLHELPRFRDVPVTRLSALADAIVAAGVHHIDGGIVADDTRYDTTRYNADWKSNYVPDGEIGPLGALTVDGGWADPRAPTPADDPAVLAGQRLRELLADRGVTFGDGTRRGAAPAGARVIAEEQSVPVAELVGSMLRASDNYAAELLTREIGVTRAKNGTTPAGLRAVTDTVEELGVPTDGVALIDGSGLAPSNRVTCNALVAVLELTRRAPFDAIAKGLPVAGQTGTLATRFIGDPLAGVLRAKTGDINGVVGLSGTVDDNEDLFFSFAANGGFSTEAGRVLQGDIARIVAVYPDVDGLAGLVPMPESPSVPGPESSP